MIDPRLLQTATTRGIVTPEQAQALGALAGELAAADGEPIDRERLRFVTGFSDVFVTIGIGLFVGAFLYFASDLGQAVARILNAMLLWGLAEIFTRRRRQALPSIVLLALFAESVFVATSLVLGNVVYGDPFGGALPLTGGGPLQPFAFGGGPSSLVVAAAAAITAGAVYLHYRRFGVPITPAVGVAALGLLAIALIDAAAPGIVEAALTWILLALGLCVFALAMKVDLTDPERVTRRADIAFWLHLLAAPLIVHPLVGPLMDEAALSAVAAIAVFLALGAVAVVIDRRAILVSGLVYVGIAFGTLAQSAGVTNEIVPLTLLALGALVILLSIGWLRLRGALMRALPTGWARRLPRPVG